MIGHDHEGIQCRRWKMFRDGPPAFCGDPPCLVPPPYRVVRAAEIYVDLKQKGRLISDADILIAATALTHDLILVTNNTAHFQRVPGLQVQSWKTRSLLR